jgi:hypothetical protein
MGVPPLQVAGEYPVASVALVPVARLLDSLCPAMDAPPRAPLPRAPVQASVPPAEPAVPLPLVPTAPLPTTTIRAACPQAMAAPALVETEATAPRPLVARRAAPWPTWPAMPRVACPASLATP